METDLDFDEAFKSFLDHVIGMVNTHQKKMNNYQCIGLSEGQRYKKITVGRSAWAFVDKKTGDVLKPASWKAPAKHARGNIFDEHNGTKYLTPYGPAYLK